MQFKPIMQCYSVIIMKPWRHIKRNRVNNIGRRHDATQTCREDTPFRPRTGCARNDLKKNITFLSNKNYFSCACYICRTEKILISNKRILAPCQITKFSKKEIVQKKNRVKKKERKIIIIVLLQCRELGVIK